MIDLILYIAAAICFALAAFRAAPKFDLSAAAFCLITLALWVV